MTPNQTALLHRILDHPRVRKYGEGRGWWCDYKITWESDIWSVSGKKYEKHTPCLPYYTGPDLAADSNLHELEAMADEFSENGNEMVCNKAAVPAYRYTFTMCNGRERDWPVGHGPTRTDAVLAALGRALNIGDTE